jgi:hypothetical protein
MREMGMPELVVEVMSSLNQVIAAGYVAEGFTEKGPRRLAWCVVE